MELDGITMDTLTDDQLDGALALLGVTLAGMRGHQPKGWLGRRRFERDREKASTAFALAQAEALRRETARGGEQLRPHPPRPKWSAVSGATTLVAAMLDGDPGALARADAVRAYLCDLWTDLGIDPRHPETLYTVLVVASTFTELARNGQSNGTIEGSTVTACARIGQTMAAAMLPLLPEEARPKRSQR